MTLVNQDGRPKSSALAVSLLVHAAVIFIAVEAPGSHLPARGPSEYKQKIEERSSKLVWYKFRKELPPVDPARKQLDPRPLRAIAKAAQAIVSAPNDAPRRTQMVWTPAPEIAPAPLLDSPNILAVKLPPKQFDPPVAKPRELIQPQLPADAPPLEAHAEKLAALPEIKLPPKPYIAPPIGRPVEARLRVTTNAPTLEARPLQASELAALRLPPKTYIPPPVQTAAGRSIARLEEPQIVAPANASAGVPPFAAAKLPPRAFPAPPRATGAETARTVALEDAPATDLPANARDLNIAIVGLNPLEKMIPPPVVSSRAEFSAGPQLRSSGAVSEGMAAGLSVPDLFVRGAREPKSNLIAEAYASPTSAASVRAAMRSVEPRATVHTDPSVPSHALGAAKVSGAPDPRFNGRDVYLMAIQMPNLTSYSGSWLMWYSARTAREAGLEPITAPVPHRKVDPKYVATAVEERIEGKVQLVCVIDRAGRVSAVELVRGIDDRLNQSAREALSKWEFYPALRSGEPVDVDVLVEIPFRLTPRLATR